MGADVGKKIALVEEVEEDTDEERVFRRLARGALDFLGSADGFRVRVDELLTDSGGEETESCCRRAWSAAMVCRRLSFSAFSASFSSECFFARFYVGSDKPNKSAVCRFGVMPFVARTHLEEAGPLTIALLISSQLGL